MLWSFLVSASLLSGLAVGDLYLQACRGSNNRLDERGRDRANGNRLFDSQNNDRGGYNVGKLSYYMGETVPISWTNQHSSGKYQLKGAEIIVQYACGDLMRDGTTTNTIPDEPSRCLNYDCDTDVEYGRHESNSYYQYCKAQERNKGLFTANQNLRGEAAIYTRQNPGGTRRGYECPEERDYYPYWRPSPWRDSAIFTNQKDRCDAYKKESQNKKDKFQCVFHEKYWEHILKGYVSHGHRGKLPLDQDECNDAPEFTYDNKTYPVYRLEKFAAHGIEDPECDHALTTRTNHHGLPGTRNYWTYNWKVPDLTGDDSYNQDDYETCCVVRARYNITTNDYPAWADDKSIDPGVDYRNNSEKSNPNADKDPAMLWIWENFGLTYDDIAPSFDDPNNRDGLNQRRGRGYVFVNNPRVDPFGHTFTYDGNDGQRLRLQLAINTNQFGRTFQDRTHCFQIKERPENVEDGTDITLLTVQGKRGNIVQVYPATEYYFIPEPARISKNSFVHFCWTGSNTNPNNNDGQGDQGTDRSNICPLTQEQYDKSEYSTVDGNDAKTVGDLGNNYPDYVQWPTYKEALPEYYDFANKRAKTPSDMADLDLDMLRALCTTRRIDEDKILDYGNMEELDDAGTTFCTAPVRVSKEGTWNFLCTRNNNFSNRSQKGTLTVFDGTVEVGIITEDGGKITKGKGSAIVVVQKNMVAEGESLPVQVTTWKKENKDSTWVEISGPDGSEFGSESLEKGSWMELWIPYTPKSLHHPYVYYRADSTKKWKEEDQADIDYDQETYYAVVDAKKGGFYKAVNVVNGWALFCFLISLVFMMSALGAMAYKKCYAAKA